MSFEENSTWQEFAHFIDQIGEGYQERFEIIDRLEWQQSLNDEDLDRTLKLRDSYLKIGALVLCLNPDLKQDDRIEVELADQENEEETKTANRNLKLAVVSTYNGELFVLDDNSIEQNWKGSTIYIGSQGNTKGFVKLHPNRMSTGSIEKDAQVAVHVKANSSISGDEEVMFLPQTYQGLWVNGIKFF